MSRAPGRFQRRILAALEAHPEHRLPRSALRQRVPNVDHANLRRAIRSLVRMGRVHEYAEDDEIDPYTNEWGIRWVVLVRYEPVRFEEIEEILRLVREQYG
jgi:hypothetical protein